MVESMPTKRKTNPIKFAQCEACPLKGRPIVPGHGFRDHPDIAFVAEAPGETEVELGVPLIGKSGGFLRKVLADIGIDENRCYFTNVCICHPAGNKTPTPRAAKACFSRLVAELVEIQPKLIVALGNIASVNVARHRVSIKYAHGVYQSVQYKSKAGGTLDVGVVPTYHPSGILRGPEGFRDFLEELQYAKSILDGQVPVIQPPYENYTYVRTQKEFDDFIAELSTKPMASVDLETDKMDVYTARILCAGFSWKRGYAWVVDWPALLEHNWSNVQILNDALKEVKLILQNGVYDIPFMHHHGLTNAYYYLDSMQAHYLLDERQGTHGLERLAIKYYRAPAYKTEFRQSIGVRSFVDEAKFAAAIATAPMEDLFDYNGADADYTYRLGIDLPKIVKEEGQLDVLKNVEMPACRVFAEFFETGLLVDRNYLQEMGAQWMATEREYMAKMVESTGDPDFNPNSRKQLAHHLYDVLQLEPFGGRDQLGKDKIDEDVISKFIQTVDDPEAREYWTSKRTVMSSGMKGFGGHVKGISPRSTAAYMLYWLRQQNEFPDWVIKWRHVRKRISHYYTGILKWMDAGGRVHPQYDLTSTRTGRKSTKNPAIHNLPRGDEIYNIFIPAPGWVNIHADYSQAELRMMAHYSEDDQLMHILETSDPHTVFAKRMFKISDEDWAKLTKAEISDKRIASKMITFGLPYGRSAAGLAPQLGITKEEAEAYIDEYFRPIPKLKAWLVRQRARGIEEQMIVSIFGRRRRFPLITDKYHKREVERQAGNFAIQSAINDLTLMAYVNALQMMRDRGIPAVPGAHIHDSINFSVPKPMWKQAVAIIIEAMSIVPFETDVKFPAECEIGERWGGMITVHKGGKWVDPGTGPDIPDWIQCGFYRERAIAAEAAEREHKKYIQGKLL